MITAAAASGAELGLAFGTGFGALDPTINFLERLFTKGPTLVNPLEFPNLVHNAPAGYAALHLGAEGHNVTACQEELCADEAVHVMVELLRAGQLDRALAGGGDLHSEWLDRGYAAVDRLFHSRSRHVSIAGALCLEARGAAGERGAAPWAEILGIGAAGRHGGVPLAIDRALAQARSLGVALESVDAWYRSATETATRGHEDAALDHPLVREAPTVFTREHLGDAGGAGAAVLATAAAAIARGELQTALVTAVSRQGYGQVTLLGAPGYGYP